MTSNPVLWAPGATRRDWALDAATTAVLYLLCSVPIFGYYGGGVGLTQFVVLAPLVVRRHSPLLSMVGVILGGLIHLVALPFPTMSLVAIPIVAQAVARWVPGNPARSVLVAGAVASVLGPVRWFNGTGFESGQSGTFLLLGILLCFAAVVTPYIIGRRFREIAAAREREELASQHRYRMETYEREQQARLDEASTRAMIARELHDIVAHSLSIMIVQAEGGRALARKKPEAAEAALDTIAEVGRDSLHEMRRIVGVLRGAPGATAAEFAPAPGLDDIPELVARTSERAHLRVRGFPEGTTPALELTVYRVVQEALTNFLKHAGVGAQAWVTLTYAPHQISAEIVDDGHGVPDPTEGGGNGIRGMHERVNSMGGVIMAGARTDGPGFRVHLTVPVRRGYSPAPTGAHNPQEH